MTTIYEELTTLCAGESYCQNPEGALSSIRIAATPGTPQTMREAFRDRTARFIMPERPNGMEYSRDNFWRGFQQRFIWHRMWVGTPEQQQRAADWLRKERETAQRRAADWLRKERETAQRRRQAWPPKPTFTPMVAVPQPWDGKDERPGKMPRDGK